MRTTLAPCEGGAFKGIVLSPRMPESVVLTLAKRTPESGGVVTYAFSPQKPVPFAAGQYAHLMLPDMPEGSRRVREFSFASNPGSEFLEFGIDTRSGSEYQHALAALPVGGEARLFKVRGHLSWPPGASHAIFVAGGVGITPFRAMGRDARVRNLPVGLTLIHASREPHPYHREMQELIPDHAFVDRAGFRGALTRAAEAHPEAAWYAAGSPGFIMGVVEVLKPHRITNVESDPFTGLAEEPAP